MRFLLGPVRRIATSDRLGYLFFAVFYVSTWAGALRLSEDEQRIIDLANAGYWPHYRLDGGAPLFQKSESKQWAAKYLLQRFEGNAPDFSFNMVVSVAQRLQSMPPQILTGIKGLTEITDILYPPGVYFLCLGEAIVYVGQSIDPISRIGTHRRENTKQFDRVYFVPIPAYMLDAGEREFISHLSPPLNQQEGRADERFTELAKSLVVGFTTSTNATNGDEE